MSMIGNYISVAPDDVAKVQTAGSFAENLIDGDDGELSLSIEKSWQAIHFVLNGDPWECKGPLGNAVLGGREVGEDMGYGPARFLTPAEVAETAKALEEVTTEQFTERLSKANFKKAEIYVFNDEDPNDPDIVEELVGYFEDVKKFFREAANKKNGMLLFIG
jgi:hypothetical protein